MKIRFNFDALAKLLSLIGVGLMFGSVIIILFYESFPNWLFYSAMGYMAFIMLGAFGFWSMLADWFRKRY
ncbi:hypothetical protein RB2501_07090 [Robiginitalea biformata HTCC2501]|uniref:Uncharacterized protein n=1 Tax=Robiginitalea biformata (strain ATCC BAA-864 / DSM 15991 / KCTC 12146 / HTCC2501) TaxID=313596 RepID=A4CI88_ROBBH|nr:hypothetical protein RB2501_07090 [Robiginitalea biformata HTCC2501]